MSLLENVSQSAFRPTALAIAVLGISSLNTAHATPTVTGMTITLPDDGWYQVQNADTYATVCEGGLNCTADAGEYIVINLTTGTRYNNIVVAGTTTETDNSFALDLVAQDLLYSLAGFSLVESFSRIEELATRQAATSVGQILTQGQFSTEDARYDMVENAVDRVLYNCSGGGTMTLESGEMSINESSYSHFRNVDSYVFDQCLIELEDDASEFYTLSGTASKDIRSRSGSRFTEGDTNHQWLDFLLLGPNDTRTEITANVGTVRSSTTSGNSSSRTATIDYYGQSEGVFAEVIQNANFDSSESSNEYVTVQNKNIDVNGYILGEATAYNQVEITTNPTLSRRRAAGPSASSNLPFTGQIEFQVTDGSFLYLTANPVEDETDPQNTLLVDLSYTTTTGDTTTTTMVPLIDFN